MMGLFFGLILIVYTPNQCLAPRKRTSIFKCEERKERGNRVFQLFPAIMFDVMGLLGTENDS